jgi:hypothetical protein
MPPNCGSFQTLKNSSPSRDLKRRCLKLEEVPTTAFIIISQKRNSDASNSNQAHNNIIVHKQNLYQMLPIGELQQPVSTTPETKKRVSFDSVTVSRNTLHIFDFTEEERQAYWLSSEENAALRKGIQYTLWRMTSAGKSIASSCNDRGLAVYSYEKIRIRQCIWQRAAQAVFSEQDRQRKLGFKNQHKISLAYRIQTLQCQEQAQELGNADQLDCETQYSQIPKKGSSLRAARTSTKETSRIVQRFVSPRHLFLLAMEGRQAARHS